MNELYWITRLDGINVLIVTIIFISVLASIVFFVGYAINGFIIDDAYTKKHLNKLKMFTLIFILTSVLNIFIPSTRDMLMIYGVGGTIDYIKSNEKAKQLPDKCINALDKFVEEYMLNGKENKEK